jgi:hypothetical protein
VILHTRRSGACPTISRLATERAAISVLRGLHGIDTPVASAILTAIDPERYTVIDFRSLEALGNKTNDRSVNFYLCYLNACRRLAEERKASLRDFDRALWQWSKEQPLLAKHRTLRS